MKIIQMFNWRLNDIRKELKTIKEQGFTHIQTSPLQGTKDTCKEWWALYQPVNFRIGNFTGSKTDLEILCREAHSIGLNIIVDVVLRHVATDNYDCNKPHKDVDKELLEYVRYVRGISNYNDRYEVVNCSCGMPMLDYENSKFQRIAKRYLNELKRCGVDMFRLDMAKHYKLPSEGGTFLTNVMGEHEWIGEVLFEDNDKVIKEYDSLCYVFSMSEFEGLKRSIKAVECHDTYLNNDDTGFTKRLSDEEIVKKFEVKSKYAKNVMFYTRPFNNTWKNARIKNA